jgi:two-component system response regulator (stage 0 sporulation protein A)
MIKTAIIADDDPISRARVEELAREQNFRIIASVDNGADAVERIFQHRPDKIFLDVIMPKLDGLGVLEELAKLDDYRPDITMVTSYRRREIIEHALKLGASDYLIKTPNGLQKGDNLLFD